jgi:hypothetical protein
MIAAKLSGSASGIDQWTASVSDSVWFHPKEVSGTSRPCSGNDVILFGVNGGRMEAGFSEMACRGPSSRRGVQCFWIG